MTTIKRRLGDAISEHWRAFQTPDGMAECDCGWEGSEPLDSWIEHLAGILLSLPGIAIIDTTKIDRIAAAIAGNWPDTYAKSWPWEDIPEHAQEAYRDRARAAILAATEDR